MTAPIRQPRASRAARFSQRDVARAIKGALAAAGTKVERVEVEVGGITIRVVLAEAGTPGHAPDTAETVTPDRWRVRGLAA